MQIEFDPDKRAANLAKHGLDFLDAPAVFVAEIASRPDTRRDYGELRVVTLGMLRERLVLVVWTPRGAVRRIISMRYTRETDA